MKFILALLLALPIFAHADNCKPAGASYIHAGKVGENFYVYAWCDDTRFVWATRIAADVSAAQLEAETAYWYGLSESAPKRPVDDPVIAELWAAASAAMQADTNRPASASWVVAPNGTYPDRPMYPVVDGVRGTKATGERATVGDKCRCEPPYRIDEGRTTYCALDARVPLAASFAVGTFSVSVCREAK